MGKSLPNSEDLARRIDALEEALDQMHRAVKLDIAALREELRRCAPPPRREASETVDLASAADVLPLVLMINPPVVSRAAPRAGIVSEVPPPRSGRDPRAEDD